MEDGHGIGLARSVDFATLTLWLMPKVLGPRATALKMPPSFCLILQKALDELRRVAGGLPCDYSENMALINSLGELTPALCALDELWWDCLRR